MSGLNEVLGLLALPVILATCLGTLVEWFRRVAR